MLIRKEDMLKHRWEDKHFRSLDFLKFCFAIVIVCLHFQQGTGIRFKHFNFFYGRINFYYCVDFFFIVSGFLLACHLSPQKLQNFKQFIVSKIVRIIPMTSLSVLACLCVSFFWAIKGKATMPGIWKIINSLTCTFAGGVIKFTDNRGINNPLWYICVLFICYAIFFLINKMSERTQINKNYFYFVMILIGCGCNYWKIDLPFLNEYTSRGYVAFFLGMLLFEYIKKEEKKNGLFFSIFIIIFIILCFYFNIMIDDQWAIFTFILWPAIVVCFLHFENLFPLKIFEILGAVSFEIYILHVPLRDFYFIIRTSLGISDPFTQIEMIIFVGIVIFVSIPTYLFVEQPIRKYFKQQGI